MKPQKTKLMQKYIGLMYMQGMLMIGTAKLDGRIEKNLQQGGETEQTQVMLMEVDRRMQKLEHYKGNLERIEKRLGITKKTISQN